MAWEPFTNSTKNYENSKSFVLPGFGAVSLAVVSKCEWSLCFINRKMCLTELLSGINRGVLLCVSFVCVLML